MKTEFNVERVCERVQLCVVDAPDELGEAKIEVRGGSIYVSFPSPQSAVLESGAGDIAKAADPDGSQPAAGVASIRAKRKGR